MRLDPIELRRLALIQQLPSAHVERRVEHLALVDDYHYAATVTQQLTIPRLTEEAMESGQQGAATPQVQAVRSLLVPLGWFPKDRLPDLQVSDGVGATLPVLTRDEQGRVAASLFTDRWQATAFANVPQYALRGVEEVWDVIRTAVERIVTSSQDGAFLVIYRLRRFLAAEHYRAKRAARGSFILSLLKSSRFWESLGRLARIRLMVARLAGVPGETYVLTIRFTEPFTYSPQRSSSVVKEIIASIRRLPSLLGVASVPIVRDAGNAGQAASLWVIFQMPPGIESVRCFWRSHEAEVKGDNISVDVTKAALGKHHSPTSEPRADSSVLDIQVAATSDVTTTAILAVILFFVGAYLYKIGAGGGASELVALASLFAATPAAAAGVLAYRGPSIVRRIGRGPRWLLVSLIVMAALVALAVGLRQPGSVIEALGLGMAIYGFLVGGLFVAVRTSPRWRWNERSRRSRLTARTSAAECRAHQMRFARVLLLCWPIIVFLFAHALIGLHRASVVNASDFPTNAWRAMWSGIVP